VSYWDKVKKRSATKQVCIGKLDGQGDIVYNKRFSSPNALQALQKGEIISESLISGQSIVLSKTAVTIGLIRVLRDSFDQDTFNRLISLAYSVVALDGKMYHAPIWMEQNECPTQDMNLSSGQISQILASITQDQIEDFLIRWMRHRDKISHEQYCFDIRDLVNTKIPFIISSFSR
jgi:hypothetical protein